MDCFDCGYFLWSLEIEQSNILLSDMKKDRNTLIFWTYLLQLLGFSDRELIWNNQMMI